MKTAEHFIVYRDENYFSSWPFNGGLWQFSDGEVAVGFIRGKCDYRDESTIGHEMVDTQHGEQIILRSIDGGRSWPIESLTEVYRRPAFDEKVRAAPVASLNDLSYDASGDGFCLLGGYGIPTVDAPHLGWIMISTDRGHTWNDPVRLPRGRVSANPFTFLAARPSYVRRDDGMLLLFAHGARLPDETHASPIVYGSTNGGGTWAILSEIELTPKGHMGIMPFPIILKTGLILAAVRRQYDTLTAYTQIYASQDGGRTWEFRSRVNDWGAPANLVEMPDGRLVCVYGYRQRPWGIRARISHDEGRTWQSEMILRDDGGSYDLGYPRTVVRLDGSLLTIYYFNSRDDSIQQAGGVRYIAGTIWQI